MSDQALRGIDFTVYEAYAQRKRPSAEWHEASVAVDASMTSASLARPSYWVVVPKRSGTKQPRPLL